MTVVHDSAVTQSDTLPAPAAVLNENHARRIASTFSYIDGLLRTVERMAHATGAPRSEFTREQPDLSETESRLLLSLAETARRRMLTTLDHLGLPRPTANLSARWNVMTALRFIDISLSELNARELSGYGTIDASSAAEVTAVAAELRDLIARGREVLQPREGERLRERLAEVVGPLGEVLRLAEELSTRLGVVEVRPLIAAAAERASTSTIDIGVFGRVSSGKSSLINALVGAPILPVGAMPVTAVPLRVVHGAAAIDVFYRDGQRESIDAADPSQLATFATERGNRDNERGVQSLLINTPRLAEGIALLDTPGVGSLSQSGPAQAFAWLPRCDLGIVLAPAGTPLGRDEMALVSGLTNAGIAVAVLLSKTDLISDSERAATVRYVESEIVRETGIEHIEVRPVSVMGSDLILMERWRDEELLPLVAARKQVTAVARARRVRALLAALNAAITERPTLDATTLDIHRVRAAAERQVAATADELEGSARTALGHAADAIRSAWHSGTDARVAARQALTAIPSRALYRVRSAADQLLVIAGLGDQDEVAARLPPLFDPPFLASLIVPAAPGVLDQLLNRVRARQYLAPVARSLDDAYGTYANRLRAWALVRIEENYERITAMRPAGSGMLAPELRVLSTLVDTNFPKPAAG